MALKRIEDLDLAASVDGTESVELGTGERTTLQDIADLAGSGSGDVVGPSSSTDGNVALYDGATGKLLKDGGALAAVALSGDADDVTYDHSTSGLTATDVQSAIDEVVAGITGSVLDVETPSNASGTVTLDFDSKSRYVGAITLAANVTTLAFSNLPGSGKFAEYELHITQDGTGGRTFAIPASHKALGGSDTSIASAANAVTVLTASTVDNGTTWRYAMQESA